MADTSVACGEPNHIIHESDLYIGHVDNRPYMSKSPLGLLNSKPVTEREHWENTYPSALPLEVKGGLDKHLHYTGNVDVPKVSFNKIDSNSAEVAVDDEIVSIESGEEKKIELESQTVETTIMNGDVKEVEFEVGDGAEVVNGEAPDTVLVRGTKLKIFLSHLLYTSFIMVVGMYTELITA